MFLDLEKRKILDQVLARRFPSAEKLKDFLWADLNKNLDDIVIGSNLVHARLEVLRDADRNEWAEDLITALRNGAGPDALALLEKLGTLEQAKEARFHDDCYVDRNPLVNRETLRARLRAATTRDGKRILLVKGDRYSGKSHALIHIRHVARSLELPLAVIGLLKYPAGEEIQPKDLGLRIGAALNLELPKWLDDKPSRFSVNFIAWLQTQLGPRRPLWVAIDDFEPEKLKMALPSAVEEFITMLAESVAEELVSARLFLVNYGKDLPSKVKPHLEREAIRAITDDDLLDFFLLFYRDHMPPTDEEAIAADAVKRLANVHSKLSNDPAKRLEQMRDALIEECQEMAP